MIVATPEQIRYVVEAFRPIRKGVYPDVPGVVRGSRTSQEAADFMKKSGTLLSDCLEAYDYLCSLPNREGCRWELDKYFYERYERHSCGIRRARDLVHRCLAYEPGELRRNPKSNRNQEVLRAIGPPQEPTWGNPAMWRIIALGVHELHKEKEKAVKIWIEVLASLERDR